TSRMVRPSSMRRDSPRNGPSESCPMILMRMGAVTSRDARRRSIRRSDRRPRARQQMRNHVLVAGKAGALDLADRQRREGIANRIWPPRFRRLVDPLGDHPVRMVGQALVAVAVDDLLDRLVFEATPRLTNPVPPLARQIAAAPRRWRRDRPGRGGHDANRASRL